MANVFDFFSKYQTNEGLFEGLRREESAAIRFLEKKIQHSIHQIAQKHHLIQEDEQELLWDCVAYMIKKIRSEQYVFMGHNPASFTIEIAKNRVHDYAEKYKRQVADDTDDLLRGIGQDSGYTRFEDTDGLEKIFKTISKNCEKLLRLKYEEGYSDAEIVEQKLTQYSTIDAVRTHRYTCRKLFIENSRQLGFFNR